MQSPCLAGPSAATAAQPRSIPTHARPTRFPVVLLHKQRAFTSSRPQQQRQQPRRVVVLAAAAAPARHAAKKKPAFPFVRIAGQEDMKLALLLNVVDPGIGGVLIMGDRGTGKSVAVRAEGAATGRG